MSIAPTLLSRLWAWHNLPFYIHKMLSKRYDKVVKIPTVFIWSIAAGNTLSFCSLWTADVLGAVGTSFSRYDTNCVWWDRRLRAKNRALVLIKLQNTVNFSKPVFHTTSDKTLIKWKTIYIHELVAQNTTNNYTTKRTNANNIWIQFW